MSRVYHLDLKRSMLRGAAVALLPGDPARAGKIARRAAEKYSGECEEIASKREFTTFLVRAPEFKALVTSTGIGGPSSSIAVEELATLGVRTFVRVGTTGAIQDRVKNGDCVITTGSVRLDGASTHYAPMEYPAVADFDVVGSLVKGAVEAGVRHHTGVTASSDTFYPGEERTDGFRKYVLKRFQGATREWRELQVLNYEMESATILTMTASMGLKGGCVTGVINRGSTGKVTRASLKKGETNVIEAAVAALKHIAG